MTGNDTRLLVVTGGVASQLEDLGRQVLEDGGEVDGRTSTDTLSVVALAEQTVDTADGERETGLGRTTEGALAMIQCDAICDVMWDQSQKPKLKRRVQSKQKNASNNQR